MLCMYFSFSFLINNVYPLEHLINSISAELYSISFLFVMLIPWKRKGSNESTPFYVVCNGIDSNWSVVTWANLGSIVHSLVVQACQTGSNWSHSLILNISLLGNGVVSGSHFRFSLGVLDWMVLSFSSVFVIFTSDSFDHFFAKPTKKEATSLFTN